MAARPGQGKTALALSLMYEFGKLEGKGLFVSFDPRMPAHLQLFVQRIQRNDVYIAELESEVVQFLKEVDDKVKKLNEIKV